ncbi:hypothetical protein FQR65_LT06645 [Abscondita terminalis]|nr:hypothetical protein FQR65_LT06645 [Abscondita terminalis]
MAWRGVFKALILNNVFMSLLFWGKMVSGDPSPEQRLSLTSRTVRTKYGDVSGVIVTLDSRHLEPVEVFRGIPYASPPLGSLRFMPPVTGALWSGVKIADKFSPVCPQRLPDIFNETAALKRMPRGRLEYLKRLLPYLQNQSEDCLYLNIYAPAQASPPNVTVEDVFFYSYSCLCNVINNLQLEYSTASNFISRNSSARLVHDLDRHYFHE